MSDTTYNGWTNYATWRVNLEIFDGVDPADLFYDNDPAELADNLRSYAEELLDSYGAKGLARDYAMAFLSDVDWHEIARHMTEAYAED